MRPSVSSVHKVVFWIHSRVWRLGKQRTQSSGMAVGPWPASKNSIATRRSSSCLRCSKSRWSPYTSSRWESSAANTSLMGSWAGRGGTSRWKAVVPAGLGQGRWPRGPWKRRAGGASLVLDRVPCSIFEGSRSRIMLLTGSVEVCAMM